MRSSMYVQWSMRISVPMRRPSATVQTAVIHGRHLRVIPAVTVKQSRLSLTRWHWSRRWHSYLLFLRRHWPVWILYSMRAIWPIRLYRIIRWAVLCLRRIILILQASLVRWQIICSLTVKRYPAFRFSWQQPKRAEAHLFSAIMTIWMNTTRTATVMTAVTIRHHQQIRYIAVHRPCLKSDARMTVPMPMKQASPSAVWCQHMDWILIWHRLRMFYPATVPASAIVHLALMPRRFPIWHWRL